MGIPILTIYVKLMKWFWSVMFYSKNVYFFPPQEANKFEGKNKNNTVMIWGSKKLVNELDFELTLYE